MLAKKKGKRTHSLMTEVVYDDDTGSDSSGECEALETFNKAILSKSDSAKVINQRNDTESDADDEFTEESDSDSCDDMTNLSASEKGSLIDNTKNCVQDDTNVNKLRSQLRSLSEGNNQNSKCHKGGNEELPMNDSCNTDENASYAKNLPSNSKGVKKQEVEPGRLMTNSKRKGNHEVIKSDTKKRQRNADNEDKERVSS